MTETSKSSPYPVRAGGPLRLCVVLSLLLHAVMILALQRAVPLHWPHEELPTYHVELIRPPVKDLSGGDISDADLARLKSEQASVPEQEQDTISLDTKDERYVSYARRIKNCILRSWRYPEAAKEDLIEGKLLVLFTLSNDGRMVRAGIAKTSGFGILDEEAIRAIRAASPFPPFPSHLSLKRLHVKAAFDYRLTADR
jgi:protein TonB